MTEIKNLVLNQLKFIKETVEIIDKIDPIENYLYDINPQTRNLNIYLVGKQYEHTITLPQIIRKEKKTICKENRR